MKRIIGLVFVTVSVLAVALVLNVGMIAGYPWSERVFGH